MQMFGVCGSSCWCLDVGGETGTAGVSVIGGVDVDGLQGMIIGDC